MKTVLVFILLFIVIACSTQKREPSSDALYQLTQDLTADDSKDQSRDRYCRGNPPGSDDAWCSWVCIDGNWSKVCK
jgi:hypothetical protein